MAGIPQIVFYHYPYSPFGRRVQWYMQLRGIPYRECVSCAREARERSGAQRLTARFNP